MTNKDLESLDLLINQRKYVTKREDFAQIIKLRSIYKIDKRKDNLKIKNYVIELIESQMKLDNLGIMENGDLCPCCGGEYKLETTDFEDYLLFQPFKDNETCTYEQMQNRIYDLALEIIGA